MDFACSLVAALLLAGRERHVSVAALLGLVIFFRVETASRWSRRRSLEAGGEPVTGVETFWLSVAGWIIGAVPGFGLDGPVLALGALVLGVLVPTLAPADVTVG